MYGLVNNANFCRNGSEICRERLFHSLILFTVCKPHIKKDALKVERTTVYISRLYRLPDISRLRTAGYNKMHIGIYIHIYIYMTSLIYMKVYSKGKNQGRGNMKTDTTS